MTNESPEADMKREVFFKRYLGLGFYLKREGDSYWIGHKIEGRGGGIKRIRISKAAYVELMKVYHELRRRA